MIICDVFPFLNVPIWSACWLCVISYDVVSVWVIIYLKQTMYICIFTFIDWVRGQHINCWTRRHKCWPDPSVCCDWFSILNPNVIKPCKCITGQANHGEHEYLQYVLSFLNRFRLIKIWYYLGSLHVNVLKIQQRKFWPKIGKHQIEHLTV